MGFALAVGQTAFQAGTTGNPLTKALTNNPAVGSIVVVMYNWYDGVNSDAGTVTITDGNSNAYTIPANQPSNARPTSAGVCYMAYFIASGTPDKTISVNHSRASVLETLSIAEFTVSGGTGSFRADQVGTGTDVSAPFLINTPTVGSSATDLIVFGGVCDHQFSSIDSPYTQIYAGLADTAFAGGWGYSLSGAGSDVAAATMNASGGWDTSMLAFQFTASGGGGLVVPVAMRQYRQRWS